ncbi:unnamed protein product, partial [Ectocarpus fasciculatus]
RTGRSVDAPPPPPRVPRGRNAGLRRVLGVRAHGAAVGGGLGRGGRAPGGGVKGHGRQDHSRPRNRVSKLCEKHVQSRDQGRGRVSRRANKRRPAGRPRRDAVDHGRRQGGAPQDLHARAGGDGEPHRAHGGLRGRCCCEVGEPALGHHQHRGGVRSVRSRETPRARRYEETQGASGGILGSQPNARPSSRRSPEGRRSGRRRRGSPEITGTDPDPRQGRRYPCESSRRERCVIFAAPVRSGTDRRNCPVGILGLLVRLRGHHHRGRVLRCRGQGGGPAVETPLL